jgi:hypothetical protein
MHSAPVTAQPRLLFSRNTDMDMDKNKKEKQCTLAKSRK